jgi:hypothetical protein
MWNERDVYKGERIFKKYTEIDKEYMFLQDRFVTRGKQIWGAKGFYVHDINNYGHSKTSAHYGYEDIKGACAMDGRFPGVSLHAQVQLALLFPFTGIFFYPYADTPFLHTDTKTWDRPLGVLTLGYRDADGKFITTNNDFENVQNVLRRLKCDPCDDLLNDTD